LYEEALEIYTRLGDWAGEAKSASLAATIYRRWRNFEQVRRLSLLSYVLWAKAEHKKGIADSLIHLTGLLRIEGKYVEYCRLMYCVKKLVSHHLMWKIFARDSLNGMSYKHKISPEQYESRKPAIKLAKDLVLEIFGVGV